MKIKEESFKKLCAIVNKDNDKIVKMNSKYFNVYKFNEILRIEKKGKYFILELDKTKDGTKSSIQLAKGHEKDFF